MNTRLSSLCLLLCGVWLVNQGFFSGYTTQTALPEHVETVHVEKVTNTIDISQEVTNNKPFQTYRPGLEVELRNALIERFIFDGHLRIASKNKADAVLKASLLNFDRDPVSYNADDSVQEFRIHVTAELRFMDQLNDEVLWEAHSLSGEATYFLSGPLAVSEDRAVALALDDLVRRAVEGILEVW